MVKVTGLGKRFAGLWVFRGLDFELEKGHRLVVLGRNGAGKSTLLKIMAGLIAPSEGSVTFNQNPWSHNTSLGYCSLDMSLYPNLTVEEHLLLAADLRGCDSRCDELLDLIDLTSARYLLASQLSTGMRARVKLALAIQPKPSLLILDEPGAGLDDRGHDLVEQICIEQGDYGALVLATNSMPERRLGNHELELGP